MSVFKSLLVVLMCTSLVAAEEIPNSALAVDDECQNGDETCGVNALQFKVRKAQIENVGTPSWCSYVPNQYQSAACRGSGASGCTCDNSCKQIPSNTWSNNPQCCGCGGGDNGKSLVSEVPDVEIAPLALAVPAWCQYLPSQHQQTGCRGSRASGCACENSCKDIPTGSWMWNPECCGCGGSANIGAAAPTPAPAASSAPASMMDAKSESACSCDEACVAKPGNLWRYDISCCGCGEGARTPEAAEMKSAVGNVLLMPQALGAPAWCQYVPAAEQQTACRGSNALGCTCDGFCKQIPGNSWQWNPQCCGCGGGHGGKALLEMLAADFEVRALEEPEWCQFVPSGQTYPGPCSQAPSLPGATV